jgi:hypothetical protein
MEDRYLYVIALDFEPFGVDKSEGYDSRLFALALLLSSSLCINTKYKFDESSLE